MHSDARQSEGEGGYEILPDSTDMGDPVPVDVLVACGRHGYRPKAGSSKSLYRRLGPGALTRTNHDDPYRCTMYVCLVCSVENMGINALCTLN